MEIKARFDHFNFNVTNLARSIKFYEDVLGLKEYKRLEPSSGDFIIVYLKSEKSDFLLELTWLKDHPQKYDLGECEFHLCIRASAPYEDVRSFHREMGVICYENNDMGLYFIEDPDGYWIEILPEN